MNYNFLIIGGDKRMAMLAQKLKDDGNKVKTFANDVEDIQELESIKDIYKSDYDVVISSLPLTKDKINVYTPLSNKKISLEELKKISKDKILITGDDILSDEATTILNTIPTAEGAIQVAMEETNYTLHNSKALVLGFGRVGKILCNKLKGIGMEVYCEARKNTDLAWIKAYGYKEIPLENLKENICKMDIVFNTIPYKILDKSTLILVSKETLIIDLASAPGGVDYEVAEKLGIKAILASALPGKVAPDSASDYIKEYVYRKILF